MATLISVGSEVYIKSGLTSKWVTRTKIKSITVVEKYTEAGMTEEITYDMGVPEQRIVEAGRVFLSAEAAFNSIDK